MNPLIMLTAALTFGAQSAPAPGQPPAENSLFWKHGYVQSRGARLHYVQTGKGQTILFLHGFPEFWYMWRRQLVEFGRTHQAVALDMRGYNLSDKPKAVEQYAMPLLIADVKAVLQKLSPGRKAILVGHDWGGVVAWSFAMAYPHLLDKLVVINGPHPMIFERELATNKEQEKASQYMATFRSPGAEELLRRGNFSLLAETLFDGTAKPDAFTEADKEAYRRAWSRPGALTGGLNYYRSAGNLAKVRPLITSRAATVEANRLIDFRVPTLVIWGEKDKYLLPGNLDGLEKVVNDLEVRRIPNATHWVVHEEPELVNRYIREFLALEVSRK